MPKYSKKCNNRHFHEKWKSGDAQIINLRRDGLLELRNIFTKMLEEHLGRKPPLIQKVCTDCLKKCIKKREFTKHVPENYLRTIEIKVIKLQYVEYMHI